MCLSVEVACVPAHGVWVPSTRPPDQDSRPPGRPGQVDVGNDNPLVADSDGSGQRWVTTLLRV
jgi:hypothetical protein